MSKLKKVFAKQWVKYTLVAVAAFAAGSLVTNQLIDRKEVKTASVSKTSQNVQKQIAQDSKERIESRYKQIDKQLETDVKNKQITQKQADTIKKKIDEAYAFRKSLDTTKVDDRKELQEQREEWRTWAKENNVSYRYFVWLY